MDENYLNKIDRITKEHEEKYENRTMSLKELENLLKLSNIK